MSYNIFLVYAKFTLYNTVKRLYVYHCRTLFQVLNSQYTFDSAYMGCVEQNMADLHPFGDVPRKLASSVKRSLVASRALVRALKTGHEIANVLTKVGKLEN